MKVPIILITKLVRSLKTVSYIIIICYYFVLLLSFFYNQINAKVLRSTQRAKDERVRNASTPKFHGKSVPGFVINA